MSIDRARAEELLELAREAARLAYAPYSKFHVGAMLLARDGTLYRGCNVENSSFGLTICAERTAAVTAIADSNRDWSAIAIVSPTSVPPCGACLQFLSEFSQTLEVWIAALDPDQPIRVYRISDLLPASMHLDISTE
jgi:cytidine deaminase